MGTTIEFYEVVSNNLNEKFQKNYFTTCLLEDACINQEHTFSSLKCLPCRYNTKYQCVKVQCVLPIFTTKKIILLM